MTIEDALNIVDSVLENKSLSTIQEAIFRQTWEGKTYSEIAEKVGYDAAYIRDVGYKLWQLLSDAFGDRVTKNNLQVILRRHCQRSLQVGNSVGNEMLQSNSSPMNFPVVTESFSQEISNGASKLFQLLARVLTEPIGDRMGDRQIDRAIDHYLQQIHDSNTDPSLKLTITVNLSKA
ncbi:MAG: hypothetical protein ACOYN8_14535 [Pseudanabaena sp.]|jgi:hypothetical protein